MKPFLYLLIIALILCACETAVEVDVPRSPSQLTVNSLFNPDSVWQVELTQNRYVLDNEPFASVSDAEVRVLQEGRTVAVLDYVGNAPFTGNSIYRSRSKDSYPKPEGSYTLEVNHPTLGTLSADSQVPTSKADIISAEWDTLDVRESANIGSDRVAYKVAVSFNDPPEENFYSLSLFTREIAVFPRDINSDGEVELVLISSRGVQEVGSQSDDPIVINPFDRYSTELLFSDASFNGQEYELNFHMEQAIGTQGDIATFVGFFKDFYQLGEEVYDLEGNVVYQADETFPTYILYALLRTTTEEYYNYHYTRDLQASVESNPFAQPVQVFDNIEDGLGIFAGYSQVEKEVIFR